VLFRRCLQACLKSSGILPSLRRIFEDIYQVIPTGVGKQRDKLIRYPDFTCAYNDKDLDKAVNEKVGYQLGTLGSGNHFISIDATSNGMLGIVIHSGSRKVGHLVASYYNNLLKYLDNDLPKGFAHLNSDVGQAYLHDMNYCLDYNHIHIIAETFLWLVDNNWKQFF